ncbi:MAG: nitronate monooxygenase [Selenomonas massiliensis]
MSIKIGKHEIAHPIIQGGMGLGISWDKLAGNVSLNGCLGVISSVGTGYYENLKFAKKSLEGRPYQSENFYSKEALFTIVQNARKICGDSLELESLSSAPAEAAP